MNACVTSFSPIFVFIKRCNNSKMMKNLILQLIAYFQKRNQTVYDIVWNHDSDDIIILPVIVCNHFQGLQQITIIFWNRGDKWQNIHRHAKHNTFKKSKHEFSIWSLWISPNVSTVIGMPSQLPACPFMHETYTYTHKDGGCANEL